jgi:hypothetical protein
MSIERHVGLHAKCPYSCPLVARIRIRRQHFGKLDECELHENVFSVSTSFRQRDNHMMKVTSAYMQLLVSKASRIVPSSRLC